jgi:CRP/FNR family transcriptional regulator
MSFTCPQSVVDANLLFRNVRIKAGQRIHSAGQKFDALRVIASGFTKTVMSNEFGFDQILNFPMQGDAVGIDGMHSGYYQSDAVALTDCNLIVVPLNILNELSQQEYEFQKFTQGLLSLELLRNQTLLCLLLSPKAEMKVGHFLVNLSERYFALGYSRSTFCLRMSRKEIASYLGLSFETVSRALSTLVRIGLITVKQRQITINDHASIVDICQIPAQSHARLLAPASN